MSTVLRAIDVNVDFNVHDVLDEVREVQFDAYRAWQDDILDAIDAKWRGWVVETGTSRRGFSLAFDPNRGRILVLNRARAKSKGGLRTGGLYAQYVHRAGTPKSNLYIDVVMRDLMQGGPVAEMIEYIEDTVAEMYR